MLTCKDFLGWLNDCLDNTADAETKAEVQRHVANCPNCWVVYNTTQRTLEVYKGEAYRSETAHVPQPLKNKLLDAISRCRASRFPQA